MEKTELIFIPWPRMGHLTQAIETANLLINRFTNLSITVLLMKDPINPISSNYIDSLSSAHDPSRIRFHPLPSPPPVPAGTFRTPAGMLDIVVDSYKPHVKHAVGQIADRMNSGDSRPIGAFVVDMFNTSMIDVADEFAIPTYVFFPSGAGFLQLMLHFQAMDDELGRDVSSLNQPGTELLTPGFVNPVPASVLPFVLLDKYQWSTRFLKHARGYRKAKGIIVNTFYDLESYAIGSFKDHTPPIYPVGPILGKPQIVETHVDVIHWLDKQPPSSVIFMCFGGQGCFGEKQVMEIANGIERSGFRFLWALRKPPPKGVIGLPSDYTDFKEVLPEGFLERTTEIGKVIGWAPQRAVLANKAVGGFVSHCGWNSILESLMSGIPIATWPMYAEQQLNAFQMVRELGLAAEIILDYQLNNLWAENQAIVTAEEIEVGIRKVMDSDSKVREKVKEMKEKCNMTMKEGGSSYICIGQLVNDITNSEAV